MKDCCHCGDAHRRRETRKERKAGREKEEGRMNVNEKKDTGGDFE